MFTALALLLVQSVIELPAHTTAEAKAAAGGTTGDANGSSQEPLKPNTSTTVVAKPDDEVLVTSSYKKALLTAHTFLSVFLKK